MVFITSRKEEGLLKKCFCFVKVYFYHICQKKNHIKEKLNQQFTQQQRKCVLFLEAMFKDYMYVKKLNCIHNGCLNAQKYAFNRKYNRSTCSLRTDTQLRFSLHVTPLVSAFLHVLLNHLSLQFQNQIFSNIIKPMVKRMHLFDCLKQK